MEVMRHASTFLLPSSSPPTGDGPALTYALVVLNQRLPRFVPLLWSRGTLSPSLSLSRVFLGFVLEFSWLKCGDSPWCRAAQLRVCADGGANRIYDGMPELFPDQDPLDVRLRYKPDVIKGDMDSIRDDVKEFYSNLEVKIVDESHDQDTTDLHKCVAFICNSVPDPEKSNLRILVVGALGGRFDHEVGNINVLYRFSNIRIILLSDDCLIYLLPKTHRHEIHIQSSVEGPHCGLIPAGAPSTSTTTTGLQWDLTDMGMNFGGLISTSNIVCGTKVTVQSDSDLLWTISIRRTN